MNRMRHQIADNGGPSFRTLRRHVGDAGSLRVLVEKFSSGSFVTPKQLAANLPRSTSTIYRWVGEGKLKAEYIGSCIFIPLDQAAPFLADEDI